MEQHAVPLGALRPRNQVASTGSPFRGGSAMDAVVDKTLSIMVVARIEHRKTTGCPFPINSSERPRHQHSLHALGVCYGRWVSAECRSEAGWYGYSRLCLVFSAPPSTGSQRSA